MNSADDLSKEEQAIKQANVDAINGGDNIAGGLGTFNSVNFCINSILVLA